MTKNYEVNLLKFIVRTRWIELNQLTSAMK